MIEEDTTDSTHFVAVAESKVGVSVFLEVFVWHVVSHADVTHTCMEASDFRTNGAVWSEVNTTTEPPFVTSFKETNVLCVCVCVQRERVRSEACVNVRKPYESLVRVGFVDESQY